MKKLIYIFILINSVFLEVKAQTKSDSLKISKIDSIINFRYKREYHSDLLQIHKLDSTNNKMVTGRYKSGQLIDIYYYSLLGKCESASISFLNDSLIFVEYKLSDPDIKSNEPPSTTHTFYFEHNKCFFHTTSFYDGGSQTCDSYFPDTNDFIKEYIYYKHFLTKN